MRYRSTDFVEIDAAALRRLGVYGAGYSSVNRVTVKAENVDRNGIAERVYLDGVCVGGCVQTHPLRAGGPKP